MHDALDFDRDCTQPYEYVRVEPGLAERPVPEEYRQRILIDTVHDGGAIPREFRYGPDGEPLIAPAELERRYVKERDWGASLVARKLASALGLAGFHQVRVARALLDFNRFPGSTPDVIRDPLDRLAINPPFTHALDHARKTQLLEGYYDRISELMEPVLPGKLIKIGVHTYDEHNPSLTRRPDVSLISRSAGYSRESRMPYGVFDPMFPDELGESMCNRALLHRMSLNLERAGFRVGHNHPYLLPDGCIEVRTQVWYFFAFLREAFEVQHPETAEDPAYEMVWSMLFNTNLRLQESEALRGYLHRYHRITLGDRKRYLEARDAYDAIERFRHTSSVVDEYRFSRERPSSLALEVRKDLVCEFDPKTGRPLRLLEEMEEKATQIAQVIAESITIYLETDREQPVVAAG